MKILLASYNKHKKDEIRALFNNSDIEIVTLDEMDFKEEIIEDGMTFVDNAFIKARTIHKKFGLPTLADDSGICIDSLGGEPGIHSARFGGYDTDSSEKNRMIIDLMEGKSNRSAHYTCALVFIDGNREFVTEKYCYGKIIEEEAGDGGFGYDPIFYLEEYDKTMAQISLEEKNKISHRGKALIEFKKYFDDEYGAA